MDTWVASNFWLLWTSYFEYAYWNFSFSPCFQFFWVQTRVELLDHSVILFLSFWKIAILFSMVAALFYSPNSSVQVFLFLHILGNTSYILLIIPS